MDGWMDGWMDRLIDNMERIVWEQGYEYKVIRHVNKGEEDSSNIENLNEWETYFKQLWTEQREDEETIEIIKGKKIW